MNFPKGSKIRPDDVVKALLPIVEVDESIRTVLKAKKLRQKYWVAYFTDLIIDRTWDEIREERGDDGRRGPLEEDRGVRAQGPVQDIAQSGK
jgi:hypothetical protein